MFFHPNLLLIFTNCDMVSVTLFFSFRPMSPEFWNTMTTALLVYVTLWFLTHSSKAFLVSTLHTVLWLVKTFLKAGLFLVTLLYSGFVRLCGLPPHVRRRLSNTELLVQHMFKKVASLEEAHQSIQNGLLVRNAQLESLLEQRTSQYNELESRYQELERRYQTLTGELCPLGEAS